MKTRHKEKLTAEQLRNAEKVTPYRHPESARTAACHSDGGAYTATGLYCGPAPAKEGRAKEGRAKKPDTAPSSAAGAASSSAVKTAPSSAAGTAPSASPGA